MMKKIFALVLTLCLFALPALALAATKTVSYVDRYWNGSSVAQSTKTTTATVVESDMTELAAGWYVVTGEVTVSERMIVADGAQVHLILEDGSTLTATQGIKVPVGSGLTIYAQSSVQGTMGKLVATGGYGPSPEGYTIYYAGIGGGSHESCGDITINGGEVTAMGRYESDIASAGIGAGGNSRSGDANFSDIIINGGIVTASVNSSNTCAIGTAHKWSSGTGDKIEINGGTVTAIAGTAAGGIGAYEVKEDVIIRGGTVAGYGWGSICIYKGDITISDAVVGAKTSSGTTYYDYADIINHDKNGTIRISNSVVKAPIWGKGVVDVTNCIVYQADTYAKKHGYFTDDIDSFTLNQDLTIQKDETLHVREGETLTIPEGVTLKVLGGMENGGTVVVNGTLDCSEATVHPAKECSVTSSEPGGPQDTLVFTCYCGKTQSYTLRVPQKVYDGEWEKATYKVSPAGDKLFGEPNELSWYGEAGTHTATLKVAGRSLTRTFTIEKAESFIETAPTALELTYTGSKQTLITAGVANGGTMHYSLDGETWNANLPTAYSAGEYTVYYKVAGDGNHNDTDAQSIAVTIAKADSFVRTEPEALELTYTGSAQTLIVKGRANGGTMHYSLDGENYDAALPTGTDAGEYTVYYKVVGDSNHNDSAGQSITVIIAQSETSMTAQADKTDYTYGECVSIAVIPTATGNASAFSLRRFAEPAAGQVSLYNGETQIAEPQTVASGETATFTLDTVADGLTPGSYTLTAKYIASGNMAAQEASFSISVAFAEDTEENDAIVSENDNDTGWYDENPTLTAPEGSQISLGCGPDAQWSDSLTLPAKDGEHTYTYYVKDENGLISEKDVTVKKDTTAPVVGELDIQASPTGAQITVPATDAGSGVQDYELEQTGGKGNLTITDNGDGRFVIDGMTPGEKYSFKLTVTDMLGHITTMTFSVIAPVLPATGDGSSLALWLALMGVAAAALLMLRRRTRK